MPGKVGLRATKGFPVVDTNTQLVSDRARRMPPFLVMEVLERASVLHRAGRSIIHLEVGEPDFATPQVIVEAGQRALREGRTHYTHSLGHPELREAIAAFAGYGLRQMPLLHVCPAAHCIGVFVQIIAPAQKPVPGVHVSMVHGLPSSQ